MYDIFLTFLWAFLLSIFAVPSIIDVSHRKKLLDEPNHRTIHRNLTPRLGGLAIFAGFVSALTIFGELNFSVQKILAGCVLLFFIGVKDDLVTVSVFKKFFIQLLATGIVMFMADIRITDFQGFLDIGALDAGSSYLFTFLVIIGITNAINLIDGIDGLAGSIILIISLTFGIYFFIYDSPYSFVAFSLAGGVVGFLRYNFYRAKIFMGDTGSLVCGFIVSVLAIEFIEMRVVAAAPAIAVAILVIPIFDTIKVFTLRILNGKSPFSPDKKHIHHQLMGIGFHQLTILGFLIFLNLFVIGFNIIFSGMGNSFLLLVTGGFAFIISIFLEILTKRGTTYA